MKMRLLSLGVLAVLLGALTALAADKGNKGNKVDPQKQVNSDNINPGEYTGKLISSPGSSGDFFVRVDYQHPDPKSAPKNYNNSNNIAHQQQQLAQAQAHMAQARTPQQQQQAGHRVQQAMQNLQRSMAQAQMKAGAGVKMINDHVDIEFHASPEMIVRNMNPPQAFDEKGNPKKYTSDELKALKGKFPNMAGYEADISALQPNQIVKVTLEKRPAPKKTPAPAKTDASKTDADKTEAAGKTDIDKDKDTVTTNSKTWVTKVFIQSDPDTAVDNKTNPKRNK